MAWVARFACTFFQGNNKHKGQQTCLWLAVSSFFWKPLCLLCQHYQVPKGPTTFNGNIMPPHCHVFYPTVPNVHWPNQVPQRKPSQWIKSYGQSNRFSSWWFRAFPPKMSPLKWSRLYLTKTWEKQVITAHIGYKSTSWSLPHQPKNIKKCKKKWSLFAAKSQVHPLLHSWSPRGCSLRSQPPPFGTPHPEILDFRTQFSTN